MWAKSSSSTMFQSISFFGPSKKPSRETWTKRITFLIASSPAVANASGAPCDIPAPVVFLEQHTRPVPGRGAAALPADL